MTTYIHDNFLLFSNSAERLYHDYAAKMPIIDYHCHLSPDEVADDKTWKNLSQVWLYGDHYKWRAMRSNGVNEHFCTGDATDREKFDAFAKTMPDLLRNPLYHWSHLELKRYFDIEDLLSPSTADRIWDATKERMTEDFSAHTLMQQSQVRTICTTDDPIDSLEQHKRVAADESFDISMLPTWRPDRAMDAEDSLSYNSYLDTLAEVADCNITFFSDLIDALKKRHDYFHLQGCRLSDHGLDTCYADTYSDTAIDAIFNKVRGGSELSSSELLKFKSAMMMEFGRMDAEKGWTAQLHIGAMRNNNSKMYNLLGPDTGFDSIGDDRYAGSLTAYFDRLNSEGKLPKTILYNLNPCDNEMLATLIGCFQDGVTPGKLQLGSGWWFLDQKDGMTRQIEALSQLGLLSRFVGMVTDSRSFLSYTRHEYFRRILCNILGSEMEQGIIPKDFDLVGSLVENISYNNAAKYFEF